MNLDLILKSLTESIGADEAAKVVESLKAYRTELEAGIKAQVAEGVKAVKITLEAEYLGKLEAAKTEGEKQIKEEISKFERLLAARVKLVQEKANDAHGDRLTRIQEGVAAKRGSVLLQEVEALVTKAKGEITEATKADPKEITTLKAEVATLKEAVEAGKKAVLEAKARANVAESETKELRESLEASLNVVVEETEATKTTPAGEEHPDVVGKQQTDGTPVVEGDQGKPVHSAEMVRMRRLAGIKV